MIKVVVVEDEGIVRQGIIRTTDWTGLNCMVVGEAADGEEGVSVIEKLRPDLVITDICMPKLTGIQMLEKLKDKGVDVPMKIFLTAYSDFSYAQSAIRLGASDYVLKPFDEKELDNCIKSILDKQSIEKAPVSEPGLTLPEGDKSKYLAGALKYIDENYSNPELSAKMVADYLGISTGHLSHVFRKETDYTMQNYVLDCRMKAAKSLLKDYTYKVYEVAEMVGYNDLTYFGVSFKKYVGVSPKEYQDRYRE